MPNYSYRGFDKSGKQTTGQISADDEQSALSRVKSIGIFPTEVKIARLSASSAKRSVIVSAKSGVRSSDLTIFSRQLANLVRGGLPLMRTFTALTEHTESPNLKAALEQMQQEIKGGKSLWEALEAYPGIFPKLYVNMVKAGEASGQLPSVLQWLADYLDKEQSRKNQIRGALAYPTLLVGVGTITIISLVTFIVPKFVSMFQEFGQALPLPTVMLIGLSKAMIGWWWVILALVFGVVTSAKFYVKTPAGRLLSDRIKLKLPLIGKLNLKSSVSKFARTTATLLQGGVTLFESMNIVRDVIGNEALARGADFVRDGMREGESFAARLKDSGVFPPLLTHMAAVGEETGELQSVLITVADAYDVEVEATLKNLVSLLEPMIIVIIGGVIAFIILAMLLPVFQINMMG